VRDQSRRFGAVAIEAFLQSTNEFEIDHAKCERFLITRDPKDWLRRKAR
jgi:cephalosporin hydroxylase